MKTFVRFRSTEDINKFSSFENLRKKTNHGISFFERSFNYDERSLKENSYKDLHIFNCFLRRFCL